MAYYAQLDKNNVVVSVFVGRNKDDLVAGVTNWELYYAPRGYTVKQTSYNTQAGIHYNNETGEPSEDQSKALRGNYAGIGYTYDETLDAFIPPTPYGSWVLDEATYTWVAPIPYPNDGGEYTWDEDTTSWIEVTNATE